MRKVTPEGDLYIGGSGLDENRFSGDVSEAELQSWIDGMK